ncbi:MAG TPA: 3-isopropylmalate dehydratase large subunit [Thermodesulfobacteriota bacterium]|jgi:3-isopropylmalate/(R)-2-methylmalate dehydratase large subunit|nr:3-isopropylmalate dehydratase large subunit [Thermodesulfobacteriota bacterium]
MGMTLAEKILSEHAGKEIRAREIVVVRVDLTYTQDGTGPLAVRKIQEMGLKEIYNPKKTIFFFDHAAPSPRFELSNDHNFLRDFAEKTGSQVSEIGYGISHQVVAEREVKPGDIVIGADSHTCTGGALGAFATGVGSTDAAVAMALGKIWLRVPETIRVVVEGKLPTGVFAKDIILHLIGQISAAGGTYKALEFSGDTIENLEMAGRLTIANMAVEAGAKVGLFPSDEITHDWLNCMRRSQDFRKLSPDPDAIYEKTVVINAKGLKPTIACPHQVDNTKTIDEIGDVTVNQVYLGTSCNGRLEDFQIAARILKGKKIHPKIRMVVTPGSRLVYLETLKDGTMETLIESGALAMPPGCGACVGLHEGVLGDGEVCLATQPRNFKGRMGSPKSFIYLGSPAVAAATAIEGKIADPRKYL